MFCYQGKCRATASAAYFYDKIGALCECYHSIGWSGTLQDAKLIAEGLLLLGIKYLVPHGFFYTTHGLKKHDAPPSFFYQMPYWPMFGKLSARVEEISSHFTDTYIDASVLLIDPHSGVLDQNDEEIYEKIQRLLMSEHIDFQIADTDILESGKIEDKALKVRDLKIKLIIVPPMRFSEKPLQNWLDKFQENRGRVIYCQDDFAEDKFFSKVEQIVQPSLQIKEAGRAISDLWIVKRKAKDKTLWFILNTAGEEFNAEIKVNSSSIVNLTEIKLANSPALLENSAEGLFKRKIHPFESFMLKAAESKAQTESINRGDEINNLPVIKIPVKERSSFSLKNKNLLRMYYWQMSLLDQNGEALESAKVRAIPISNQLEEGKFSFRPFFKDYFGQQPELNFPELDVMYIYSFFNQYSGKVELVMEPESICGDWEVMINGFEAVTGDSFKVTDAHVRGSLGLDISDLLMKGQNSVKVKVRTRKANDGLLNPLYLAGDFGVTLNPLTLVEAKTEGDFEDYQQNFIPYYSGVLEYKQEFSLSTLPESENVLIDLQFEKEFQQAVEVSINNGPFKPLLWEPRLLNLSSNSLRKGNNELKIRVYTTLIRSFSGMKFDDNKHII